MKKLIYEIIELSLINKLIIKDNSSDSLSMIGCSNEELEILERKINFKLPQIYRDFLLYMGHKAGLLFCGDYFFYNDLMGFRGFDMKIEAENLLLQCESEFKLPKNSFVFGNSAGYSFWYFIINGSEDPPVYFYIDYYSKTNNNYPIKIFDKLSDFYIFSIKSLTNN